MKKSCLIVAAVAVVFMIFSCGGGSSISSSSKYFDILNSTETHWNAGTIDAGSGVDYHLFLSDIKKDTPVFDTAWINHQKMPVDAMFNSKRKDLFEVHAGYTIDNSTSTREVLAPVKYKGKGLFRYRIKGKVKYLVIKEFELQKPINLQ